MKSILGKDCLMPLLCLPFRNTSDIIYHLPHWFANYWCSIFKFKEEFKRCATLRIFCYLNNFQGSHPTYQFFYKWISFGIKYMSVDLVNKLLPRLQLAGTPTRSSKSRLLSVMVVEYTEVNSVIIIITVMMMVMITVSNIVSKRKVPSGFHSVVGNMMFFVIMSAHWMIAGIL